MSKKKSRYHETLENTKTNKPMPKKSGKDFASLIPVCDRVKQSGSSVAKSSVSREKISTLTSKAGDSTASGSKFGGSRSRLSHQSNVGHQATRHGSLPARPTVRLRGSQSFSSLQASSLSAAPFMRSSRSLSRLDQRATDSDSSQVKRGQATGKKILDPHRLSSSVGQISNFLQSQTSSSSVVSTTAYDHHSNNGKKQTKDGVYTLCAMTSGMRRNWVQAVLKNVRPSVTHDATSSHTEQFEEHTNGEWTENSHQQQPEGEKSLAVDSLPSDLLVLPPASPAGSHINPSPQAEDSEGAHPCQLNLESGLTDSSSCADGYQSDSSASTVVLANDEFKSCTNTESPAEQPLQPGAQAPQREDQLVSINTTVEYEETLPYEQKTGQLVKELEQTQRELCRIQQLNRSLQDELQQEREAHSRKLFFPKNDTSSPLEQSLALQQLQKMNHNLCMEVEALKRSQEEAREAELRRRVDLLAQQAQLLVTGDATALAQLHLEQDRQQFQEQQMEWERCMSSLKSQLNDSDEKRRHAESQLVQVQQELQSQQSLQQEAEQLRKHLQDMSAQLRAYEEAQADKEARLQKHLTLLQASQERERRSLAASLAQAEQHSKDLQEKLDRTEQQVENLSRSEAVTREIEEAQQQLQEELACTVSTVHRLQEDREQLGHRCQDLQNQLTEADREVSRLQERLKTEETHYYNLEHSYERVCEEVQVASGKVQQRESELQDIREGYERLLDRKEQELSEVLLKMEVLGNSLEETEMKLSEVMKVCRCNTSPLRDDSLELVEQEEGHQQSQEHLTASENSGSDSHGNESAGSGSIETQQYIATAEDDPEKFMSVIQLLETKLFITEEKLRDITQRLGEHQNDTGCQDPHLCSQLTQSRATAQHLSLLLHSQAKQSLRFARETENGSRMLVGRFQVALNIIQACRERIQATAVDIPDIERQLATVAACLQQGEKEAERVLHDSYNLSKEEDKILSDEKLAGTERDITSEHTYTQYVHNMLDAGTWLMRELFVVEKMVCFLQSRNDMSLLSTVSREKDVTEGFKSLISQRIALKIKERTESGRSDCGSGEPLDRLIGQVCAEAELIYAALKLQHQYESMTRESHPEVENQREGLADISPSELTPYDGHQTHDKLYNLGQAQSLLEKLVSRLQRRANFLRHIYHEINREDGPVSDGSLDFTLDNSSAANLRCIQEQVKIIYLSDRLYLDVEHEFQQSEMLQKKMHSLLEEQDIKLMAEQEALNQELYQLQEHNSELKEELEQAEQKIISVETGNHKLLEDIQKIEDYHQERMQKLEANFQEKIKELQHIHEEEMKHLHGYYTKSCASKEKHPKPDTEAPHFTEGSNGSPLSEQAAAETTSKDLDIQMIEADTAAMREAYLKDLEKLQESRDQGFTAMEEMHRKLIKDLQQQHQKQVAELLREKDQLLQEETAATMAAIVAMRRAHKQELERSKQSQHIRESADVTELHREYEREIQLLHKELEVLSTQHTAKCLENSQLSQELQNERKSVTQYQKENQELRKKQREMDDVSRLHEGQSPAAHQLNSHQTEMIMSSNKAEMHFLRQEARSLREELELARMDKVYMEKKLNAVSVNNHNVAYQRVNKDSKFATWSPGRDASRHNLGDSVTMTNNPTFTKKTEKSSIMRQIRGIRSKSLKDGLSLQERLKMFESF
ncbi:uncharacterized protein ACNS7B_009826 isoform 2-T2 [Menidia menidia]